MQIQGSATEVATSVFRLNPGDVFTRKGYDADPYIVARVDGETVYVNLRDGDTHELAGHADVTHYPQATISLK